MLLFKVSWIETKAKVACEHPLVRKNNFTPDPQNIKATDLQKDYNGSGFDRVEVLRVTFNTFPLIPTKTYQIRRFETA
jgi:hypothetical protein